MRTKAVVVAAVLGAFVTADAHAQPLQISPPIARPPASIPKPAQQPKAAQKPKAQPKIQAKTETKAATKPEPKAAQRPVPKKSIEPKVAAPPAASAPSAFAPDTAPIAPFTAPEKPALDAPVTTKTTALQPQAPVAEQGDVAFGAYQRGYYLAAFKEATRRASEQGDPVAMTLLGDLYSNGYGVAKDEKKALAWFSLAADRGDKQAIFALAMARFAGRGGAQDLAEAEAGLRLPP